MSAKVSVCMITYNQEKFIAQAIDGVMMQKTNFDIELIIGEDCSTDRTRDIIIDYQKKFPGKIKLLLRKKNLGMMGNFTNTLLACRSKYVALCEGDDYWTDPDKLQKQVDFLDKNPDYNICSHNADIYAGGKLVKKYCRPNQPETINLKYLLAYGSGGPTCSLVIRSEAIKNLPDWFYKIKGGDWAIQIIAAQNGKMKYFDKVMGVYRRHNQGALYAINKEAIAKGESEFCLPSKYSLEIIDLLDKYFNYKYNQQLNIQKTYWYDLYITGYLQSGDIKMAKKYYHKILNASLSLKFWRYPLIIKKRFFKLFILLLPDFILKKILTKLR